MDSATIALILVFIAIAALLLIINNSINSNIDDDTELKNKKQS
jgi:hypothetical protein